MNERQLLSLFPALVKLLLSSQRFLMQGLRTRLSFNAILGQSSHLYRLDTLQDGKTVQQSGGYDGLT